MPGNSLKGASRTILLSNNILEYNRRYSGNKKDIKNTRYKGRRYLEREANNIENKAFNTLKRNEEKKYDAVYDTLSGLRISDSKPLSIDDLVLCQKIDVSVDGNENKLNVLRECLKPNTNIEFELSIDTQLCKYTVDEILEAINNFYKCYLDVFLKKFKKPSSNKKNSFYLGGGSGYVSKTVSYPLYGDDEGVKIVSNIFQNTLNNRAKRDHKHEKDVALGVSPHMLKCTRYNNNLYEMGLCNIDFVKMN